MPTPRILVSIVTHNSERYIDSCLEGLKRQRFQDLEIAVVDNASADETLAIIMGLRENFKSLHLFPLRFNIGFCGGNNLAINLFKSEYVLVLNPDVFLTSTFLSEALRGFEWNDQVGMVSGKLLRIPQEVFCDRLPQFVDKALDKVHLTTIDSTGLYFTHTQRHFDRGSNETDHGQYNIPGYVFGPTGAAALYKRTMIDSIKIEGELFDELFFAYREDADLAWRAQIMGWKCAYVPSAVAYHVRRVLPERRGALPPEINMHSVKNRFMMRLKNMEIRTYLSFIFPITLRDIQIIMFIFLFEQTSLKATWLVLKNIRRSLRHRNLIKAKKKTSTSTIERWFGRKGRFIPISSVEKNT